MQNFAADEININSVALSPDGRFALSGSGGISKRNVAGPLSTQTYGQVVLWETGPGKKIATLDEIKDYVSAVAFSPDGRFALSASGNTLKIWDVSEWTAPQAARQ